MNHELKQIFHTNHPYRWLRFKWGGRLLLFFFAIAISILVITMVNMSKESLSIPLEGRAIKKVLTGDIPAYRESSIGKRYKGMRDYIEGRLAKGQGKGPFDSSMNLPSSPFFGDKLGIRAAFYVTWNNQSFFSLRRNISKINLVLPEWFFIDGKADTLFTRIDKRAFDIIKTSGVKVMPMLSNNDTGKFNGVALHRILNNKAKKDRLINDVVKILKKYNFAGINVDFEELIEKKNEALSSFQKELYQRLHSQGFLVTQNVPPFNEDYNYKLLAKYNDYLFLMAYDQYSDGTGPGPICSQKWIEAAVDKLVKDVPTNKIILNIAGYGFDWPSRGKIESITYQEALTTARESEGVVHFDNDTYNLHYNYYDDRDILHQVYFTDAATNFNSLRFATEYGLAGTALWRLGSEDNRLWDFYNKPMTRDALKKFNFAEFNNVAGNEDVDYLGEGDILDILSTPTDGKIKPEVDTANMIITEENYIKLPSTYVVRQWGKTNGKKLVLTYDDGPDPLYTPEILDTLAFYHVPAAFFVVGIQAENNIPIIKRIYNEGFEIGNHTFSHPNMAIVSKRRALLEMDATRLLIECITGHSTIMFRAPFNADSDPEASEEMVPIALSRSRNYITIGESIDPNDWDKADHPEMNADTIFNRVVYQHKYHLENGDSSKNIILLHDAGGDRSETVKATGMIIRYFRNQGYTFTTIADLLGKKPDDMMPPVAKGTGYYLLQFNFFLAELYYIGGHLLNALFIVFLSLSAIRVLILGVAAFLQRKKEKLLKEAYAALPKTSLSLPLVSIIVPAFNEEINAISSLENLLRCDYPEFEIIFVDDGSKDSTLEIVREAYGNHPKVKIFTKSNGGKSSALDLGIEKAGGDFLVCIDADTHLLPNAVSELMKNFINEKVGAVAGVVKVGNEVNILTKWQSIEYISSQNFDRKGFAYFNAITVVPGAIGAFRKEALLAAGGFTIDTLAEDCDLTIRILKAGYIVANEPNAIANTEAPETVKQFMKQRFRWSFGVMQTFWKHKELLFNDGYKSLGWIALPDILLFKYIVPFFSPLADFFMLIGILTNNPANHNAAKIGKYYLIFLVVDTLIAAIGFAFEKEKPWKLILIIPQRLIYRWLMIIVLIRSFRRAIKGELQNWGVLKRTGNVKETDHRAVLTS